jgi:hypothetical protein
MQCSQQVIHPHCLTRCRHVIMPRMMYTMALFGKRNTKSVWLRVCVCVHSIAVWWKKKENVHEEKERFFDVCFCVY